MVTSHRFLRTNHVWQHEINIKQYKIGNIYTSGFIPTDIKNTNFIKAHCGVGEVNLAQDLVHVRMVVMKVEIALLIKAQKVLRWVTCLHNSLVSNIEESLHFNGSVHFWNRSSMWRTKNSSWMKPESSGLTTTFLHSWKIRSADDLCSIDVHRRHNIGCI